LSRLAAAAGSATVDAAIAATLRAITVFLLNIPISPVVLGSPVFQGALGTFVIPVGKPI
jgi:hypothetical protein